MQPDAGPGNPVEKLVLNPIPETWDQAQVISHPDLSRKISRTTNPKGQCQGVVRAGDVKQLEPNQMNIPNEMIVNQVEHRYAGNNWAVVAVNPGEWMHLTSAAKPGSQIFNCWSKIVKLEKRLENQGTPENPKWVKTDNNEPIHPSSLEKIQEIRAKLSSGQYVVKNTRLVKA